MNVKHVLLNYIFKHRKSERRTMLQILKCHVTDHCHVAYTKVAKMLFGLVEG